MGSIPQYTRGIIRERPVASRFDPQAISDAGSMMRGASAVLGAGADLALRHKQADDMTAVNEAVIAKQKSDMEWLEQARKQRENNPFEFAKQIEPDLKKRDAEMAKSLPSSAARKAFMDTAGKINLQTYQSNFTWENQRKTQIYAGRVKNAIDNNNIMMLRAGRDGGDPDEFLKNVDAATVAAAGVFSSDKIATLNQAGRGEGLTYFLQGVIERNPYQAKKILESRKYDDDLGADGLSKLYQSTDKAIIEREKIAAAAAEAAALFSGDTLADPSNTDHRKAINNTYKTSGLLQGFVNGDAESVNETMNLIAKTSIIPESVQTTIRGHMVNGTDEQKQQAYEIVARIEGIKPSALTGPGGFTEREVKDAAAYTAMVRSGATPDYAINAISVANDPVQKDMRDLRQSSLNTLMKDITPDKVLSEFGGFLGFGKASFMGSQNEAQIFADYRRIYSEEYLRFGDDVSAHNSAMAAIKVNSGVSYVTGQKTITQFPPEEYYGVPELTQKENAKWMRKELAGDLENFGYTGRVEDVALVPAVDTKNRVSQGKRPLYHAMTQQEVNGFPMLDFVRDERNMPVAIGFDTQAQERKVLEDIRKQGEASGEKRAAKAAIQQLNMPFLAKHVMGIGAEFEIDRKYTDPKENALQKERARLMNEAADFYGIKR
jgi:hypothetical protein